MYRRSQLKSIGRICEEIDWIIANKDYKQDYKNLHRELQNTLLHTELLYSEIDLFCTTILKMAKTKNRTIRYIEGNFWNLIYELPFYISRNRKLKRLEKGEFDFCKDYPDLRKKMLSRVIRLSKEILELPADRSKGSEIRRSGSLRLLAELTDFYQIPGVKELFLNSIRSKKTQEQYWSLVGLMNYYERTSDKIDNGVIKALDEIIKETEDRSIASICLQIQINAGIICEATAVIAMDDWKDEHYF